MGLKAGIWALRLGFEGGTEKEEEKEKEEENFPYYLGKKNNNSRKSPILSWQKKKQFDLLLKMYKMSLIWLLYLKSFRNGKRKKESSHFQNW